MCDICVIVVYIPDRFRKSAPFQQDTLGQLRLFADSLSPSMCKVILGDFNCKIERNEIGQICGAYVEHTVLARRICQKSVKTSHVHPEAAICIERMQFSQS